MKYRAAKASVMASIIKIAGSIERRKYGERKAAKDRLKKHLKAKRRSQHQSAINMCYQSMAAMAKNSLPQHGVIERRSVTETSKKVKKSNNDETSSTARNISEGIGVAEEAVAARSRQRKHGSVKISSLKIAASIKKKISVKQLAYGESGSGVSEIA